MENSVRALAKAHEEHQQQLRDIEMRTAELVSSATAALIGEERYRAAFGPADARLDTIERGLRAVGREVEALRHRIETAEMQAADTLPRVEPEKVLRYIRGRVRR